MLDHRLRRWPNIKPALAERVVFAGVMVAVSVYYPRKHGAFTQCCFNVGPASKTMGQHWNSIGWRSRVCWDTWLLLSIIPLLLSNNQEHDIETMLAKCWASVADDGLTLNLHCFNVLCLLGSITKENMYIYQQRGVEPVLDQGQLLSLRLWPNIQPALDLLSWSTAQRTCRRWNNI